ncbi:16S rRNA (adenine1518-N6/adenine1519-N6)-dimethyltransferase [Fusobacterium sp. PH5-44]
MNNQNKILDEIISVSNISKSDNILEIGPGQGALTERLLNNANFVTSVEIDADLEKMLRTKFQNIDNFRLIMGDFLELDLNKLIKEKVKIVANIPYYITSPIIQKIIDNRSFIENIYIMVQKEVAERICATKGKERSVLTLSVEYFGKAKYLFTVPKEAFTPAPKVDSAFMSIELYKDNPYISQVEEEIFFKYIKAAFANKRKTILNNLSNLDFSKDKIKEILLKTDISEMERAENISIEKYIELILLFEA